MLIATTAAVAGMAPTGAAASVATQRSQAALVLHRIEVLDWRRSHMAAVERSARAHQRELQESIRVYKGAIASQHQVLIADQAALASLIVGDYKGGTSDTAAYVLASGSFAQLVQRVDEVNRINSSSANLLRQIRGAQKILGRQQQRLSARYRAVTQQVARLDAARRGLDSAIAARQAVLAGMNAQIAGEIAAEQARRSRLAGEGGGPTTPPGAGGGQGGFTGEASWYGPGFAGHRTADGEIFNPNALTAASPWLPFNTMLRVTDLATGRSVVVRINDRGPFGRGVLDLSAHAARIVGLSGWAEVQATILN
jgi:rare lipoprotein A (peptidoglycan hydrolase)